MTDTVLRTATAVIGGGTPLEARVVERLARGAVGVRAVDPRAPAAELAAALEGVDTVVLLERTGSIDVDGTGGSDVDLQAVRSALDEARRAGVRAVVAVSSAMVYGAHDDNAVPLTETAPLRPNPDLTYAAACVELERLVGEFGREDGARATAVLRPAVVLGPESTRWLSGSPWGRRGVPPEDPVPPRQFVHADDVAGAVELACARRLDGAYNVAPDGWIPGDTFRELVGGVGAAAPARLRPITARLRRAVLGPAVPRAVAPYTRASWVVAADRLRAEGWVPRHTSEETYVEADVARGWRALSPRARQELSLAAVGAVAVATVVGVTALLWRRARR